MDTERKQKYRSVADQIKAAAVGVVDHVGKLNSRQFKYVVFEQLAAQIGIPFLQLKNTGNIPDPNDQRTMLLRKIVNNYKGVIESVRQEHMD